LKHLEDGLYFIELKAKAQQWQQHLFEASYTTLKFLKADEKKN
jgi:hypothetical protein